MSENALFKQQDELQIEADEVVDELKLSEILSEVGKPVRVGSSALRLMVWRDIDMTVICPKLDIELVAKLACRIMVQDRVRELRFLNDAGSLKTDARYPDGLYFGVKYTSQRGSDWKVDIWFVDEPERQPDLQHIKTMPPRLTKEVRASILKVKSEWATRNEYGKSIKSYDIYTAVLDDNVRTPDEFNDWLKNRLINQD